MKIHENTVTISTPIRFKTNPTRAIEEIVTFPDEKTIALGGVETGSIKAQEAASVTGKHNCKTSNSLLTAKVATTGTYTFTSAKFDITSVA